MTIIALLYIGSLFALFTWAVVAHWRTPALTRAELARRRWDAVVAGLAWLAWGVLAWGR